MSVERTLVCIVVMSLFATAAGATWEGDRFPIRWQFPAAYLNGEPLPLEDIVATEVVCTDYGIAEIGGKVTLYPCPFAPTWVRAPVNVLKIPHPRKRLGVVLHVKARVRLANGATSEYGPILYEVFDPSPASAPIIDVKVVP